jgi:hypothetical protein
MGNLQWVSLFVLLLAGCGASHKSKASHPGEPSYGGPPQAPEMEVWQDAPAMESRSLREKVNDSEADYGAPFAEPAASQSPDQGRHIGSGATAQSSPMVVYTAHMRLRVKRLLEAMEAITSLAQEQGGYLESMSEELAIVRVPAKDFDETMQRFASLGTLLWKRVEAQDVTAAYTDLQRRADVARWARERLLALLEKERDVNQRLRILAEVKRQTELIEGIEAQLKTYRNLVDYFTLFIELEPVLAPTGDIEHRSPFPWIRQLRAHAPTIPRGGTKFSMELPKGFVLFENEKGYTARAADTTVLRAGRVDNDPLGDGEFWGKALDFEMEGRDEEILERGAVGAWVYRVYRDKELQPRYYLVAVWTKSQDLWVLEVFFPTEAAWQAHGALVKQALATPEVR